MTYYRKTISTYNGFVFSSLQTIGIHLPFSTSNLVDTWIVYSSICVIFTDSRRKFNFVVFFFFCTSKTSRKKPRRKFCKRNGCDALEGSDEVLVAEPCCPYDIRLWQGWARIKQLVSIRCSSTKNVRWWPGPETRFFVRRCFTNFFSFTNINKSP